MPPASPPRLTFSRCTLPSTELELSLPAFAESVCPRSAWFVEPRLKIYDDVILAYDDQWITSFGMVQEFDLDETHYAYIGPLFSRRGAYLPLFTWYAGQLAERAAGRRLFLAAEVQNPEVLLAFHILFSESVYPRIEGGPLPDDIRDAVATFAAQLSHIGAVDPVRLTTHSECSLFVPRVGYEPVMDWFRRRKIDLAGGDNQFTIVRGGPNFLDELTAGLASIEGDGRERVLERFRRQHHV